MRLSGWQKDLHIDISKINEREDFAAGGQDLAGLRQAVKNAPDNRCREDGIINLGLDFLGDSARCINTALL